MHFLKYAVSLESEKPFADRMEVFIKTAWDLIVRFSRNLKIIKIGIKVMIRNKILIGCAPFALAEF